MSLVSYCFPISSYSLLKSIKNAGISSGQALLTLCTKYLPIGRIIRRATNRDSGSTACSAESVEWVLAAGSFFDPTFYRSQKSGFHLHQQDKVNYRLFANGFAIVYLST